LNIANLGYLRVSESISGLGKVEEKKRLGSLGKHCISAIPVQHYFKEIKLGRDPLLIMYFFSLERGNEEIGVSTFIKTCTTAVAAAIDS